MKTSKLSKRANFIYFINSWGNSNIFTKKSL